jgi:competence protein ComEA
MKYRPLAAVAVAATALVAATLHAAAPLPRPAAQQAAGAPVADDPDTALFNQMCSKCHDAARITAMRRTKTEWEEVINKMIEKGATGTEKEFENVYGYLLRNYGKLHINLATPDEITTILGLSDKDAQGIVTYRKSNGPFADLEAVRKVPEIDLKKLDEHKDAVAF